MEPEAELQLEKGNRAAGRMIGEYSMTSCTQAVVAKGTVRCLLHIIHALAGLAATPDPDGAQMSTQACSRTFQLHSRPLLCLVLGTLW